MAGHSIKNGADQATIQDAATEKYPNKKIIAVNKGVVCRDIKLAVASVPTRKMGCSNVTEGKTFALILGTDANSLSCSVI